MRLDADDQVKTGLKQIVIVGPYFQVGNIAYDPDHADAEQDDSDCQNNGNDKFQAFRDFL